jgi:acyl-coenzyme A thioesterase PaaI-like protein
MVEAFQDRMNHNLCFGCGAGNDRGLQLKSYWEGRDSVCTFQPALHHMAGPRQVVNGGIISTIIDCHSVCTAIAFAYRQENREIGSDPHIWYATGSLKVDFLRPTPIDQPIQLRAQVIEKGERKIRLACVALSGGQECAVGDVLAVRVKPEWYMGQ